MVGFWTHEDRRADRNCWWIVWDVRFARVGRLWPFVGQFFQRLSKQVLCVHSRAVHVLGSSWKQFGG